MGPTDQKNTDDLQNKEDERDEIGKFVRECEGLNMEQIFEKAGFKRADIDKMGSMQQVIDFHRRDHFNLSGRYWERPGEEIYRDGKGEKYFVIQKIREGKDLNWFYMYFVNADFKAIIDNFKSIGLDSNPDPKIIANIVASYKFEKRPVPKPHTEKAVEDTRKQAKKNLRHWEKK